MSRRVRHAEADALVDGQAVPESLAGVAVLVDDLRSEFGTTAAPAPRPALAARLGGHRPLHSVPDPFGTADDLARARRRRRGLRTAAAAVTAGVVVFGSLAAAGALPAPLQRASSELGARVGIHLPAPGTSDPAPGEPAGRDQRARRDPAGAGDVDSTTPGTATRGATPPSTAPAGPAGAVQVPPLPVPRPSPLPVPRPSAETPPTTVLPGSPRRPLPLDTRDLRRVLRDVPRLLPIP